MFAEGYTNLRYSNENQPPLTEWNFGASKKLLL